MKKETAQKMFLILLPVMAVALATTANSVTVVQPPMSIVIYGSYFDLIPEAGNMQILPPVAALLALACVVLAVLYVVLGRTNCKKAMGWVSFASATFATLPFILREEVLVVPNVMLPVLMAVLFLMCNPFSKKEEQKENAGRRLEKR